MQCCCYPEVFQLGMQLYIYFGMVAFCVVLGKLLRTAVQHYARQTPSDPFCIVQTSLLHAELEAEHNMLACYSCACLLQLCLLVCLLDTGTLGTYCHICLIQVCLIRMYRYACLNPCAVSFDLPFSYRST
ncbi:hypothetical protein ABBQ32_009436 [Trebouxia sp. C0010 RCD-2024]